MASKSVFISHSHQDNEWCRQFVIALKAAGYDVWYDETGLAGGVAWIATIQRELQTRDLFFLVLTPEAWASSWVQDELQLAMATRRVVVPVLLKPTHVDGFLLTRQWVDVVGQSASLAMQRVIVALDSPSSGQVTPAATSISNTYVDSLISNTNGWKLPADGRISFRPDGLHIKAGDDKVDGIQVPTDTFSDMTISVLMRVVGPGRPDSGGGIAIRHVDTNYEYVFIVSSSAGKCVFWRYEGNRNSPVSLVSWTENGAISRKWGAVHSLKIVARGPQFDLYVNDTVVGHAEDPIYPAGPCRLVGMWDSEVAFSNLTITAP